MTISLAMGMKFRHKHKVMSVALAACAYVLFDIVGGIVAAFMAVISMYWFFCSWDLDEED